jgi:AraC family transcriptional regulator
MFLKIKNLPEKKFVGMQRKMTFESIPQETVALWSQFMPLRKTIKNNVDLNLYSLQVYDSLLTIGEVSGKDSFTKWALAEVLDLENPPNKMESFILNGGLYAVFLHKGLPQDFVKTQQYIFREWLPNSEYEIDHRPHFEILGASYKNNDPSSEEEFWLPICLKSNK